MDKNDLERDFGDRARVVLQATDVLNEQSAGTIIDVIAGTKKVETYRFKRGIVVSKVKDLVLSLKNELQTRVSQDGYRELLVPLVQKGFLSEATKTTQANGYSVSRVR